MVAPRHGAVLGQARRQSNPHLRGMSPAAEQRQTVQINQPNRRRTIVHGHGHIRRFEIAVMKSACLQTNDDVPHRLNDRPLGCIQRRGRLAHPDAAGQRIQINQSLNSFRDQPAISGHAATLQDCQWPRCMKSTSFKHRGNMVIPLRPRAPEHRPQALRRRACPVAFANDPRGAFIVTNSGRKNLPCGGIFQHGVPRQAARRFDNTPEELISRLLIQPAEGPGIGANAPFPTREFNDLQGRRGVCRNRVMAALDHSGSC